MTKIFHSKHGQVLIVFVVALITMLLVAGLAVDVGMAYLVKTRLNAAVDAAAIAAGRVISADTGPARAAAANFFRANYPNNLLGATVDDPSVTLVQDPTDNSWTITVSATATSPTYTSNLAGIKNFTVGASSTTIVRTVDLILVMDCSGSIGADLVSLKAAAISFINSFHPANDRLGLVHFASGAVADTTITSARGFNFTAITNIINSYTVVGATTSEEAMRLALVQLDAIPANSQNSLRAIVFFTDGAPNGVAGDFQNGLPPNPPVRGNLYSETTAGGAPGRMYFLGQQSSPMPDATAIRVLPATDYTNTVSLASYNNIRTFDPSTGPIANTRCNVNMAARNMLENVANRARSESGNPVHIYTIGLGGAMTTPEIGNWCPGGHELGSTILQRLANVPGSDTYNPSQPTGIYAFANNGTQLNAAFTQVKNAILRITK